jgi:hypothetical protein
VKFTPAAKDRSRLETAISYRDLGLNSENAIDVCYLLSNWDNSVVDSGEMLESLHFQEKIVTSSHIEEMTRANNPYVSNYNHPINASSDSGTQPDSTDLDESEPGDSVYERTGSDSIYSWIECGFRGVNIPISSIINNITIYMGYKCDLNWNLSSNRDGILWSTISGGIEHNITNYSLSSLDRDDVFISTSDLPSPIEFNNGIYIRITGKDEDGGSPDYFELDYLYFSINYSIPNIIINEVMFDPIGNDNNSEWVELYNAGASAVDLNNWNITDSDGNRFILSSAGTIQPGDYLVCHIAQSGVNSSTDIYGGILFQDIIQPNASVGKDNYLDEGGLNSNYGSETFLEIVEGIKDMRPLIEFNLSGISGLDIISSTVWLFRYDGNSNNDATVNVHRIISPWTESGSCWNTYDGSNDWPVNNNGGDWNNTVEDSITIIADRYGWYSWDITTLTNCWNNNTYPNYGIIFLNSADDPAESFYSSDYSADPNLRPKLIIDYWSSSKTMLDDTDSLSLIDSNNNIVDYIAWGADPGGYDDSAVAVGQWTEGAFINTSLLAENETIARDDTFTDTDTTSDWENLSNTADPYGVNSTKPTPGTKNADILIPEFDIISIPIIIISFMFIYLNRYNTKCPNLFKKRREKEKYIPKNNLKRER